MPSPIYRIYLRTFDGTIVPDTKTITSDVAAAAEVFEALVGRVDLDGEKCAVELTYNSTRLAFHRFDRAPGQPDYWRGRTEEIQWPSGKVGRPATIGGGRRVNVYLGDATIEVARRLGNGNISAGLTRAVGIAAAVAGAQQDGTIEADESVPAQAVAHPERGSLGR